MRYGSVCSGIEAATVAWHPLGWKSAFFSEIEKFPRAVLQHHYPHVPLHGDFTTIKENDYEPIDLLCGGTPCQSFSIAGLRGGLGDGRGNLTLEFVRLAERLKPRWLVWENVPGVLSSKKGRDFGAFLGGLAECGYGFAYRVLDAQYFGVPQRRRRVVLIGYSGDWRPPAAVLFERESLLRDITPRREKGQELAGTIARSSFSGGAGGRPEGAAAGHFIAHTKQAIGEYADLDIASTLSARDHKDAEGDPAFTLQAHHHHAMYHNMAVRRLTPRECERLQGFPDDYTNVPYRGKSAADGSRYKVIGNSWAVPKFRWVGERIQMVENLIRERAA